MYINRSATREVFADWLGAITRKKPILVVKGAQSPTTRSISGTATMPSSASEGVVDALFQQTGVIRLDTLQEMFDVAALMANQPLPRGRRVAIVTNSAGVLSITADALLEGAPEFRSPRD